jgi:hypothetical protein
LQREEKMHKKKWKLTISSAVSVLALMDEWPGCTPSAALPPSSWKGAEERSAIETLLNEELIPHFPYVVLLYSIANKSRLKGKSK